MTVDHRPGLVLLDLVMPEVGGDECCRLIKQNPQPCSTPVVVVALGGGQEEQELCRSAGRDDVLMKPIDRQYLQAVAKRFFSVSVRPPEFRPGSGSITVPGRSDCWTTIPSI